MNYWTDLYKEITEKISNNIPEIKWCDLWHEQINYLAAEHPFPTPAVFLAFNTVNADDSGVLVQTLTVQCDMYLYYETFADTYMGSYNQADALDFLQILNKLYALFHGRSGQNYSTMRRVDMRQLDSGGAGNFYKLSMHFVITDYSAQIIWTEGEFSDVEIEQDSYPIKINNDKKLYEIY